MKSSSYRGEGDSQAARPKVRTANLSRVNRPAGEGPVESYNQQNMFVEEPYHDFTNPAAAPVEEEAFDYSMMGRPNNSAVMPKKRPQNSSQQRRRPSNTGASQARRAPAKKKKPASQKSLKGVAVVLGVVASIAAIVGLLFVFGVFKPRIEVTMADGTIKKIKAETAYRELTEGDKYYDGTIINDINIGGMTRDEAYSAISTSLEAAPLNVDISLKVKEQTHPLDLSSLTLTVNTNEVLDEAFAYSRPTDPEDFETLTQCYNAYQAMKNVPVKYQTAYTCSTDGLTELVHSVLDPLQQTEANALITDFDKSNNTYVIQPEVIGLKIDCEKAVNDVKGLLEGRVYEGTVEVESEDIVPEITQDFINTNYGRISSCSSTCTNNKARNNNINQACLNIDGTIINPGEEFSFNGVVGQRTEAAGFQKATVIAGGQYEQGLGGGICQVSTMVYGAAVKADMEIVNRRAHAWPSNYVDPGLDATVDWPGIDFVFRNNSQYQIVIRAEFNSSNKAVVVSIYGHKLPDNQHIEFISKVNSTTPHGEPEYVANTSLAVGETNTLRNAHDGMNITSFKVWYDENGTEIKREEVATTNYRAYTKRVEVGTKLPSGGQAQFDPQTGKVITPTPKPTATPTPKPVEPTEPTNPPEGGDEG